MSDHHNIPSHLIPSGDEPQVLTADKTEAELNKELDTDRWVYTDEPDDGTCPYCGCEYEGVCWASNVQDGRKGVCPYDTSISDFIVKFVHRYGGTRLSTAARTIDCFCGPEHGDTFVTHPCMPDYDIKRFEK
jgi:hypothetical protein